MKKDMFGDEITTESRLAAVEARLKKMEAAYDQLYAVVSDPVALAVWQIEQARIEDDLCEAENCGQ